MIITTAQKNKSVTKLCRDVTTKCVAYLVAVIHQDEEEVKATHDGSGQVHILLQTLAAIVAPAHRVGGSEDGCASVQGGLQETDIYIDIYSVSHNTKLVRIL